MADSVEKQVWSVQRVIDPMMLGLGRNDWVSFEWDPPRAAYLLRVSVYGDRRDLAQAIWRLCWELESMEKQIRAEADA